MAQTPAYEKARCAQLLGYYAYYGESRRENSDGTKNGLWIAASVDCAAGRYEMGLAEIERLLTNKHFPIPGAEQASTPRWRRQADDAVTGGGGDPLKAFRRAGFA